MREVGEMTVAIRVDTTSMETTLDKVVTAFRLLADACEQAKDILTEDPYGGA